MQQTTTFAVPAKRCRKCGEMRMQGKGCGPCRSAAAKARHLADPEKQKARSRAWYLANKEKAKVRAKAWAAANPEEIREIHRRADSKRSRQKKAWARARYAKEPEQFRARSRAWYAANTDRAKALSRAGLLKRYGLTVAAYDALLEAQGGACAICLTIKPGGIGGWKVDHDHSCCPGSRSCGRCIRGLLCNSCNLLLGKACDSADLLRRAIEYLQTTSGLRLVKE